jgi:hypothetical protein
VNPRKVAKLAPTAVQILLKGGLEDSWQGKKVKLPSSGITRTRGMGDTVSVTEFWSERWAGVGRDGFPKKVQTS